MKIKDPELSRDLLFVQKYINTSPEVTLRRNFSCFSKKVLTSKLGSDIIKPYQVNLAKTYKRSQCYE